MKILITAFILFVTSIVSAQESLNVELVTQVNRGDVFYSGSWVYADPNGQEYALLGAETGTAIYKIMPDTALEVAFIPGPTTHWREITVVGQYGYVVTDAQGTGHSMQVIDLTALPQTASLLSSYSSTFTKGHIIQRDIFNEAPYVYVCGTSSTSGMHIMDVSNPANPVQVGLYQPGYYIHDCHVRGNIVFAAAFYEGTMDIVDITDKTQPELITRIPIPGGYTHSSSLTLDGKYLIIAPERDGLPARIYNVEDPDDVFEVATYSGNYASLVHNPYVRGDYAFISHNTEGMRVLDIADPTTPVEVGFYDTYPGPSGGFHGLWSACPYMPSGRIIGGNREDGLYVWSFNNARAGRFYGRVLNANTAAPIPNAEIIVNALDTVHSDPQGAFRKGYLPGSFNLLATASGYEPAVANVELNANDRDTLDIYMTPLETAAGQIPEQLTALIVYPNPAEDLLYLNYKNLGPVSQLKLNSLDGSSRQSWIGSPTQISLKNHPPGIYILIASDKSGNPLAQTRIIKK